MDPEEFRKQRKEKMAEELQNQKPLSAEEFRQQSQILHQHFLIENALAAPEIQAKVIGLKPPVKRTEINMIIRGLYREQIKLEMIPKDVLRHIKTKYFLRYIVFMPHLGRWKQNFNPVSEEIFH